MEYIYTQVLHPSEKTSREKKNNNRGQKVRETNRPSFRASDQQLL